MKLKSLLFGSAAAVIVASGAQAADAIVAEPEPMEYVKVCDTYGSSFFYIPGTETCLRIGGEVRTQYRLELTLQTIVSDGVLVLVFALMPVKKLIMAHCAALFASKAILAAAMAQWR